MASMSGRDEPNARIALNRWNGEHAVGDKRIILGCDNRRGNSDRFQHVASPGALVIIGGTAISAVRRGVAIVEFTDASDRVKA